MPENMTDPDGFNITEYTPDFWVGVLACADQFQFRNPANGRATALTSISFIPDEVDKLHLNNIQNATMRSLYSTVGAQTTYYSVHSQGAHSLRSSDTLTGSDFTQIDLPDNQWMIEATEMFSISMAKLQQQILAYATSPTCFHEGLTFIRGDKEICGRQKIRGVSGFLSFSVLGISFIFVLGFMLILTALMLDTAVSFVRRKLDWCDHKRLQWAVDEKLQLQRLAFEEAGQGRWPGGIDAVPTTSKRDLLGFGPDVDKDHPRFARNEHISVSASEGT